MILESEISECPEFEVKSEIGNIFVNEKILEGFSVKIYKIDPYFYEHYGKKRQVDENGCKYVLFRIDVYFTEYLLAIEVDEKAHTDGDLIFEKKRQEALEKNLVINLLELIRVKKAIKQTMKPVEYKHLFVTLKNKNKELKKIEKESNKEIKELEDEIKKLNIELSSQTTQ